MAPKLPNDCIAEIKVAAGRDLSDDEVQQILREVERRRKVRQAAGTLESNDEAYRKAAAEAADDARLAALIEKRSRAINILRKAQRLDFYRQFDGDEARAVSVLNVGSERAGVGVGRSVDAEGKALEAKLIGPMVAELRAAGLHTVLAKRTPAFEREIARNMWALNEPDGKLTGSKQAQDAARILVKYQEAARQLQNDAGAWIGKVEGYIVRQSHDMHRIRRAGFEEWRDIILPRLDPARTFADVDDPELHLRRVYNGLATGEHYRVRGADDWLGGFKGPGNLAKRASQERSLHFRDADAWYDYADIFGASSLLESAVFGLRRAAQNTALMRTWGTNPEAAFLADMDGLRGQARDRADAKAVDRLRGTLLRSEFDQITGLANIPGNPSLAMIGSVTRATISMAKLGGAVLSSLPDIAVKAATLKHQGVGFLEGYGNGLRDFTRGRGSKAERLIADEIGVGMDGFLGSVLSRFMAQDSLPGTMAKAQNLFFRANLLSWWTDGKATGAGLIMAHNLARNTGKAFGALDPDLRISLERYGIREAQWDALRQGKVKAADGRTYLTPDAVNTIPRATLEALAGKSTDAAVERARLDLELGLRAFYSEQVSVAITQGGARERAIASWGTKPGTAAGEAVRFLMQFKLYPITYTSRHWTREWSRAGIPGVVHLITATTALGYLSMSAKEIAKGRQPRDPNDLKTWVAAFQQGGGLGIYGDFLFGEYNRFGGGAVESLMGPAVGTVSEVLRSFGALREGEVQQSGAQLVRSAINAVPFVNLFYTRAALDYLLIYNIQEAMNPGYLRRFERRIERENGQSFIVKPSEVIPHGGGMPRLGAFVPDVLR